MLERDLTTLATRAVRPVVSGDRVAWESFAGTRRAIVVRDLSGGREWRFSGGRQSSYPVLSDARVAWLDVLETSLPEGDTAHVFSVSVADLDTGETRRLTDPAQEGAAWPAIAGAWVAFRFSSRSGGEAGLSRSGVRAVNVQTGEVGTLAEEFRVSNPLGGDGRWVVWSGSPQSGSREIGVWAHDLTTGRTERISPPGETHLDPNVSGSRVVWTGVTEGAEGRVTDVFLFDLETRELRNLTRDALPQRHPAIGGDRVVWVEGGGLRGHDEQEIGTLDLLTDVRRALTRDRVAQRHPDVSGDRVVWMDSGEGITRIVTTVLRR